MNFLFLFLVFLINLYFYNCIGIDQLLKRNQNNDSDDEQDEMFGIQMQGDEIKQSDKHQLSEITQTGPMIDYGINDFSKYFKDDRLNEFEDLDQIAAKNKQQKEDEAVVKQIMEKENFGIDEIDEELGFESVFLPKKVAQSIHEIRSVMDFNLPTIQVLPQETRLSVGEEVVRRYECNNRWDYLSNGKDWNCQCSVGKKQSPINLCGAISTPIETNDLIFRFSDPELFRYVRFDQNIKNTDKVMKMDYHLGEMYYKGAQYKGYQIQFHLTSEHSIDSELFDMEMQMIYKLVDLEYLKIGSEHKQIMIVSILFKSDANENMDSKFLNQILEYNFPANLNENIEINRPLQFDFLFGEDQNRDLKKKHSKLISFIQDKIIDPKMIKKFTKKDKQYLKDYLNQEMCNQTFENYNQSSYNIKHNFTNINLYSDETIQDIKNFFSDNTLDILGNYYIYNGSFTTPPCDELVTYVVKENPIKVSENQINRFARATIAQGNVNGNNRALQQVNQRDVFYYKKPDQEDLKWFDFLKEYKCFKYPFKYKRQNEDIDVQQYMWISNNQVSGINGSLVVPRQEVYDFYGESDDDVDLAQITI